MICPPARSRPLSACLLALVLAASCSAERATLGDPSASREVEAGADGAPSTTSTVPALIDTVRLAIGADWSGDPADAGPTSASTRVVAGLLHEGLTSLEADGSVVPGLAERWFVSDDRRQWTFVLSPDLTDGLGNPLTARDVKASFEAIGDRGPADPAVADLWPIDGWSTFVAGESGGVSGLVAIDDTTLLIGLSEPFEPLPELLAAPAYGITGVGVDGALRTTGAYRYTDDPSWLEAVDPSATIQRVELVRSDGNGAALLASRRVDWAVLGADRSGANDDIPGDVLRLPLDLRVGIAARHEDIAVREALLGVLEPALLVSALSNATLDVSQPITVAQSGLPVAVVVHVPTGPLAPLGGAVARQLADAGVEATVVELEPEAFAEAVVSGEAGLFPMVSVGGAWPQSTGLSLASPGGLDDVFGLTDDARSALTTDILTARDAGQRSLLTNALIEQLVAERLLLPVARFEILVGVGAEMDALRILPDGTLDLSGF